MKKKIFALGFFDGVHLGHQMVLDLCQHLAQERGLATAAITFDKHPQTLFTPQPPALLNTLEDRRWLIRKWAGIDDLLVFPVNEAVMGMPWQDFLAVLVEFGAAGFVCGEDFRFGRHGEGNAEKLAAFANEHNLPCCIAEEQTIDGEKISSTRIRKLLELGELENATRLLGHFHYFTATVVPGRQLGRTIGVPTANMEIPDDLVRPASGVYACRAWVDGNCYIAVTNIGSRPTVEGHQVRAESWILDFEGDLYGKTITLEFHTFLRPEVKFASLEELRAQIQKDAAQTRRLLR